MSNFMGILKVEKNKDTNVVSFVKEKTNKGIYYYYTFLVNNKIVTNNNSTIDWMLCTEEFVKSNIDKLINAEVDVHNHIYYVRNKLGTQSEKDRIKSLILKKYKRAEKLKKELDQLNKEIVDLSAELKISKQKYRNFRDCITVTEKNSSVYLNIKEDVDSEFLKTLPGFCGDENRFIYDCEVFGDNLVNYSLVIVYNSKDGRYIRWGNENTICDDATKQLVNYVLSFMARRVNRKIIMPDF